MSSLRPLLKQELLRCLYSSKFITMGIFSVLSAILCIRVQVMDFQDRELAFDEEVIRAEHDRKSIKKSMRQSLSLPIIRPFLEK
jgi:hypothetical protein